MSDDFYRVFEDQHRGSRELIKSRLRVYLPFLEPLVGMYPNAKAIDLGCGRGEWLELMKETGFKPYGVDFNDGMLKSCLELKLPVEKGDAIAFLATLPSESQAVVSAFHVVEHISFEQLRTVVSEALRVLKPGGLLILETPNPENLILATRNFYLDPTHLHPIPPQLLSFLPEYYGFKRVNTLRLQESAELSGGKAPLTVLDVLGGVSPDYAVVAQKAANPKQMALFDAAFQKNHGLSLETLAQKYEAQIATVETTIEKVAAETRAAEIEVRVQKLQSELDASQAHAGSLNTQLGEKSTELASREATLADQRAHNQQLQGELNVDRAKIVELNQTLKETLTRRHEAQIATDKAEARVQQLQTQLDAAQARTESLKVQLAENVATLASRDAALAAQQTQTRQLENERGIAKAKIDALNQEIKETLALRYEAQVATVEAESRARNLQSELNATRTQLGEKITALAGYEATLAEQQARSQRLQDELDVTRTHINQLNRHLSEKVAGLAGLEATLTERQVRSQLLADEWNAAKIKIDELNHSSHHWWTVADGLTRELKVERDRAQWLENEWNAAKAKIAELNQTSHHWWTVSTSLNHELQSVYHSKSWRITWPLRKLMQLIKWLVFLPVRLVRLPKRAIRWMLVKAIAFVLRHPVLKVRAKSWLCGHPGIENRLRRLATAKGLVNESVLPASASAKLEGSEPIAPDPNLSNLTPRARQIYAGLKAAINHRRKEPR